MVATIPIAKGKIMLLLELAATINPITVALATMVVEWWVANDLEVNATPQYNVVWHDLWCHVLLGADVSLLGETRAQVVQLSLTNEATIGSLVMYWDEVHGQVVPLPLAEEALTAVLPYANAVVEEWSFTMNVVEEVCKCITYFLYFDPF